jgi:nicotinamide phosphoribosyltransferase
MPINKHIGCNIQKAPKPFIHISKVVVVNVTLEKWMVDEAEEFCQHMFGFDYFNKAGWMHIINNHGGKLPIRIKAVPEGLVIPTRNVLMSVENTDPMVPWLTNFIETMLVRAWYPISVATNSYYIKKLIKSYADKAKEEVSPFHLNDFGARGVSSKESAGIGGSAHLVNFMGTDTLEGIQYAKQFYNAQHCGFSVMAAEHSTVTIYGKENEEKAYDRFLSIFPENALLSIVCDSYDTINAVSNIFGDKLKSKVLERTGKLVVRPDSGDPAVVSVDVLNALWSKFGGTVVNGYKVLNPKVGMIYGDGINYNSINRILYNVVDVNKFAPSNIVFGMGGALLQELNRDTHKFAFKCSQAQVGDTWVDVFKEPVTDTGKKSKRGRQFLIKNKEGQYETVNTPWASPQDIMQTVFEDGEIVKEYTFEEVRANSLK